MDEREPNNTDELEEFVERKLETTSEVASRAKEELSDMDKKLDERFDKLEEKAQSAQQSLNKTKAPASVNRNSSDAESARGLGLGLTLAYGFVGPPIVFFLIGKWIDSQQNTTTWASWLAVVGTFMGFAFLLITLNRHQK